MTITIRFLSLLLAVASTVACGGPPPHQVRTLPSGRTVKVLGVVQMKFAQGRPALMLRYLTDINIKDRPALRKEADEIWEAFRPDVEKAELTDAILSANHFQGVIFQTGSGFNLVFKKNLTGEWRCLDDR